MTENICTHVYTLYLLAEQTMPESAVKGFTKSQGPANSGVLLLCLNLA